MQTNIEVGEDSITGTLHKLTSGSLVDTWGEGYFLALKWSDIDANATSLMVGLNPSVSSGMIEGINDPDHNGVFKITNKDTQKFRIMVSGTKGQTYLDFDLSGLTLEE